MNYNMKHDKLELVGETRLSRQCFGKLHLNGSVKEPNKFHIYETEKIIRKASDTAEYIKLFGSFTGVRHARHI